MLSLNAYHRELPSGAILAIYSAVCQLTIDLPNFQMFGASSSIQAFKPQASGSGDSKLQVLRVSFRYKPRLDISVRGKHINLDFLNGSSK
jgi:hypothetical protein